MEVIDFEVHPGYTRKQRYFDVAVLKLARPVNLSATRRTICLPEATFRQDDDGISLTVAGWGATDVNQYGKSLHHARLQVQIFKHKS